MKRSAVFIFSVLISVGFQFKGLAQIIYHNNFDTQQPGWGYYNDVSKTGFTQNGKYTLVNKNVSYSIAAIPVNIDYNRDFSIETTVTHISGINNYPIGITFGGSDLLNLYYFVIAPSGSFIVRATNKGASVDLKPWTPSTAIRTGDNVPNKLRVAKIGPDMVCYINDVEATRLTFYQPFGNQTGFLVQNMQTAAFDYLTVTYNNKEPVKPKATVPLDQDITETVYSTGFIKDDTNGWVIKPTDSVQTAIRDGQFMIARTAKLGYTASVSSPQMKVDMNRDFLIEADAAHITGTTNYSFGIQFGCDNTQAYEFGIASAGYYSLGYLSTSAQKSMIPWTASDAINQQNGAKNKLSIEKKGANLNLYINNQLVDSYPALQFTGQRFGLSVTANQTVAFDNLRFAYTDHKQTPVIVQNKKTAQPDDTTPPVINITSPAVNRGLKIVQNTDKLHVAGMAHDDSGIFSVVVNGVQAKVDDKGNFNADIDLAIGDNPLMVVATDMNMNKGVYKFAVSKESAVQKTNTVVTTIPGISSGKFYALLIGVQDYQDQTIPSLDGPVKDASSLSDAIKTNYTFANEDVTLLKNPNRDQIFEALDNLAAKVKENDNLLIFYAGHGNWDDSRMQGYWYPADAKLSKRDTWITNADLIEYINAIKSKHTLLITDACFAGSIFKSRGIETAPKDIQELYKLPSRKAMTSGALKEVPDKSVFIEYLVKRLNQNTDKYLPSEQLFSSFRTAVINNSENGQVPQFGEIRQAGDEGGDFIFIKKQ